MLFQRLVSQSLKRRQRALEKSIPAPFRLDFGEDGRRKRILLVCRKLRGCFESLLEELGHISTN